MRFSFLQRKAPNYSVLGTMFNPWAGSYYMVRVDYGCYRLKWYNVPLDQVVWC